MKWLFITTILCILSSYSSAQDLKWDHLFFTQEWPISNCISYLSQNPNHTCNIYPELTTWAVHGLWPAKGTSRGPNYCNRRYKFNETEIFDLLPDLKRYWTNVYAETKMTSLWKHEWEKHGTCAAELEQLGNEHLYFKKGIDMVQEYNLITMLQKFDIVPNNNKTYKREEIVNAINQTYHVHPVIDCDYDLKLKTHHLSQIKLCFNTSLQLIDCDKYKPKANSTFGSCPEKNIVYPATYKDDGDDGTPTNILIENIIIYLLVGTVGVIFIISIGMLIFQYCKKELTETNEGYYRQEDDDED